MIGFYIKTGLVVLAVSGLAYIAAAAGPLGIGWVILIVLISIAVAGGVCHLNRTMTVYTVTRSRVVKKSGIINVRKEQARVDKITNIIIDRNLSQRMLGIGDLDIDTANDSTEASLLWWGIRNPYNLEALIDDIRNDLDDPTSRDHDDYIDDQQLTTESDAAAAVELERILADPDQAPGPTSGPPQF